jgi:hypothetical protein
MLPPEKEIKMKLFLNLIMPISLLVLSSCSSLTDAVQTGAGAGVGAAAAGGIGYAASHGNLQTTAISGLGGAAGGGLLTSLFQAGSKKKKLEEQQKGYNLGRSDTVKSLYWMARNLQKPKEDEQSNDISLQIAQEDQNDDHINTVPYQETIATR